MIERLEAVEVRLNLCRDELPSSFGGPMTDESLQFITDLLEAARLDTDAEHVASAEQALTQLHAAVPVIELAIVLTPNMSVKDPAVRAAMDGGWSLISTPTHAYQPAGNNNVAWWFQRAVQL
jgi:hypothetical protein